MPRVYGKVAWLAVAWVVTALACGVSSSPARTSTLPARATPFGPGAVWVAVYDIAPDPQQLATERSQIVATLGDALEGAVVITPAGCFDGLPKNIHGDTYVLAVQQDERVYLRALVEQLDGHPGFLGGVTAMCTD
jgi:hypothetical protein